MAIIIRRSSSNRNAHAQARLVITKVLLAVGAVFAKVSSRVFSSRSQSIRASYANCRTGAAHIEEVLLLRQTVVAVRNDNERSLLISLSMWTWLGRTMKSCRSVARIIFSIRNGLNPVSISTAQRARLQP